MLDANFKILEITQTMGSYVMLFKQHSVKVNKSILDLLGYPKYVNILLNAERRCLALAIAAKPSMYSLDFSTSKSVKEISSPVLIGTVRALMTEWEENVRYRVRGEYNAEDKTMIFDLNKATIFTTER